MARISRSLLVAQATCGTLKAYEASSWCLFSVAGSGFGLASSSASIRRRSWIALIPLRGYVAIGRGSGTEG